MEEIWSKIKRNPVHTILELSHFLQKPLEEESMKINKYFIMNTRRNISRYIRKIYEIQSNPVAAHNS